MRKNITFTFTEKAAYGLISGLAGRDLDANAYARNRLLIGRERERFGAFENAEANADAVYSNASSFFPSFCLSLDPRIQFIDKPISYDLGSAVDRKTSSAEQANE